MLVLLNRLGAELSDVEEVCSKEQALEQCERFLNEKLQDAKRIPMESTAAAADFVIGKPSYACIVSEACGYKKGLHKLAGKIQDEQNNETKFAVIEPSKEMVFPAEDIER